MGEMCLEFGQIGNIADVVADAVLLLVRIVPLKAHVCQHVNRFEDGEAIRPAASEVIDLPTARGVEEVQKLQIQV